MTAKPTQDPFTLANLQVTLANGHTQPLYDLMTQPLTLFYFYPKSSTPGCTKQSCELRDHYADLSNRGVQVIGVTKDKPSMIMKFIEKQSLNFPIISDEQLELIKTFMVWKEKKFMGRAYMGIERSSFLFDGQKKLIAEYRNVKVPEHFNWLQKAIDQYHD